MSAIDSPNDSLDSQQADAKYSNIESKAHDLMTRGRALNSGTKFNHEAFDQLSRAIKLNPYLIDAWIELTKCYQKKSDIDGAIACLENALKFSDKPNKVILRRLSTCIRQRQCDNQESKVAALLRSLELSKLALRADLNDEENYYNLAKAYMCLFFATECAEQQLINLSRAAYSKALALSNENSSKKQQRETNDADQLAASISSLGLEDETKPFMEQSDFLFNFSTVLVYFQEFDKALEYLRLSHNLDRDWGEPKALEECLVDYLKQIQSMLNEFGKNPKKNVRKFGKIIESLKSVSKIEADIQSDQQRLSQSSDLRVKSFTLDELEVLQKQPKVVERDSHDSEMASVSKTIRLLHLKLVSTINYNQAMYLTFIAIDQNFSLVVVTIYNLAASRCPSTRDTITFVNPKIEHIQVGLSVGSDATISYNRIDAREFKGFYVNGHRISTDQVSRPQFRISVLP